MSLAVISRVYLENIPDNSRANERVLCVGLIVLPILGFIVIWFSGVLNCLLKSLIFWM